MKRVFVVLLVVLLFCGCATRKLIVIPRGPGNVAQGYYEDGFGASDVEITLSSGEILKGRLIWIPPKTVKGAGIVMIGSKPIVGTGISSGNTGMLSGTIVGNRGMKMRIQLLCNTMTGRCVGVGVASDGTEYDIQI